MISWTFWLSEIPFIVGLCCVDNKIVCIIDDNKNKLGTYIRGIQVVGNRKDISECCQKYGIEEIIIAVPSASKEKLSLIVDECQQTKCNIRKRNQNRLAIRSGL